MEFKIKWKRRLFWRTQKVIGASYLKDFDKMAVTFKDGSQMEIPEWSKCYVRVGKDWFEAAKANMEQQAGQTLPIRKP